MIIARVAEGKAVERWANLDTLGLMQQLGAIPSPEQAQALEKSSLLERLRGAGPGPLAAAVLLLAPIHRVAESGYSRKASFRHCVFSEIPRTRGQPNGAGAKRSPGPARRLRSLTASLDPLGRLPAGVVEQLADDLPAPVDTR
jgi:hypothetical protein